MPPYVVLFWIICAIAGSLIGRRSGHHIQGLFFGLLLGPVGVLITCFWRPLPRG